MSIVPKLFGLFALIVLGLGGLAGIGWLLVGPLLNGSLIARAKNISLLDEIPLMLTTGLVLNFGLLLVFQSLRPAEIAGGIAALLGITCFSIHLRRGTLRIADAHTTLAVIGALFVCAVLLSPILTRPLFDWDARSVWFFHAKMIYTAGTLGQSAGWQDPSAAFSFSYYPVLVPALAAEISHVVGVWNEYLPKLSLFFMLVPASICLFSFARRSLSFLLLALCVPYMLSELLWNGYMDGYLAFYFLVALLLLGRYIRSSRPVDLISSLTCLVLLLYIKNEGVLAFLAGLCSVVLVLLLAARRRSYSEYAVLLRKWKYYTSAGMLLVPFGMWEFYKAQWGLRNPYGIGTGQSLERIASRLADGSILLVYMRIYWEAEAALFLVGLLCLVALAWRTSNAMQESLPILLAVGIYSLALITVYMLTPYDLAWQLSTSVQRTMLPAAVGLLIASYYLLDRIEMGETATRARPVL